MAEKVSGLGVGEFLYLAATQSLDNPHKLCGLIPANAGKENPYLNARGRWILYCFDIVRRRHVYLSLDGELYVDQELTHLAH